MSQATPLSSTSTPASGGSPLGRLIPAFVRAHWIALCVAGGLILLYALAGFFLVPHLARTQAQDYVRNTLHRQLDVGEITFNPFTFEAVIRDLRLSEADGSPILGFEKLQVNAELSSLLRRAIVLKIFRLEGADVDLIVERDGSVNLAKLAPQDQPAEDDKPLPRVRIGELAIANGRVDIEDRTRPQPFTAALAPIHFKLTDFRTDLNYRNAYAFSAASDAGEQFEWSGDFTVQPLGSRGQFAVTGLRARTVDDYLGEDLPFRLASGVATLRGEYEFALDPLTLDIRLPGVELQEVALTEREGEGEPPVRLSQVNLNDTVFSYGQRSLTVDEVLLSGVQLDVVRESASTVNLMRLAGERSQTEEPPAAPVDEPSADASTSAEPAPAQWLLKIGAVKLSDGTVQFEDRTTTPAAKLALTPITLSVLNVSTDAAAKIGIEAEIGIRNGVAADEGRSNSASALKVNGELQREPMAAQLSIGLDDFDLPTLQPYIAQAAALTLHSGKVSVDGQLTLGAAPADKLKLKFAGNVSSSNLRTTDRLANEDFIKWGRLDVAGIEFEQNPDRLSIQKITARNPYARVIINQDQTLNVARVLNPHGAAEDETPAEGERKSEKRAAEPAKASSDVMPMRIRSVQVIDGSAHFADYSIEPSFATGILGLEGTVTGLSSDPGSRATVKLKGAVDKYAPVDIEGTVNLLSAAVYTDIAMNFRNMELTTFNPYSGKFAGYNISKGKLSTELKYKVEDRQLDAQHHIVLDNLEFGEKTDSKDAAPIPVKLAVALLKDRNGVIDIDLPVTGSLDDPEFRLGPIIWKALVNLLTKVVTAPFAALGALFGGGEDLAFVDFPAGSAELGASDREKLDKLAKALVERPELRLDVPLTLVADRDATALARRAFEARVPPAPTDPEDAAARRQRLTALEKAYTGLVKSAPEYPPETRTDQGIDIDARIAWIEKEMLEKLRPEQSVLEDLARQRAQVVQSILLENPELSPERVFITTDRQGVAGDGEGVRMELKLE